MSIIEKNQVSNRQMKDFFKTYQKYKSWVSCIDFKSLEDEPNKQRREHFTEMQIFISKIDTAVSKLTEKESHIIRERYLNDDQKSDTELYRELKMSRSNFYIYKKSAFDKLGSLFYLLEGER